MVVFVGYKDGKSKEGKPYHMTSLIDVRIDTDENGEMYVSAFAKSFFSPTGLDCSDLVFGDVVKCEFHESEYLGAAPDLVSVKKVADTPYNFAAFLKG